MTTVVGSRLTVAAARGGGAKFTVDYCRVRYGGQRDVSDGAVACTHARQVRLPVPAPASLLLTACHNISVIAIMTDDRHGLAQQQSCHLANDHIHHT